MFVRNVFTLNRITYEENYYFIDLYSSGKRQYKPGSNSNRRTQNNLIKIKEIVNIV